MSHLEQPVLFLVLQQYAQPGKAVLFQTFYQLIFWNSEKESALPVVRNSRSLA
jgi:hypothetical protein